MHKQYCKMKIVTPRLVKLKIYTKDKFIHVVIQCKGCFSLVENCTSVHLDRPALLRISVTIASENVST